MFFCQGWTIYMSRLVYFMSWLHIEYIDNLTCYQNKSLSKLNILSNWIHNQIQYLTFISTTHLKFFQEDIKYTNIQYIYIYTWTQVYKKDLATIHEKRVLHIWSYPLFKYIQKSNSGMWLKEPMHTPRKHWNIKPAEKKKN